MTVNHLVPGSIPGAGAIQSQTPYISCFNNNNTTKNQIITTFLQQYQEINSYLAKNMKYLQKIGKIYYLVLRQNNKIIKKSLNTSNIEKANIRKLKILKGINKLNNFNTSLKVITIIEDGDDEEEAKKIIKSINRTANNKTEKA